MVQRISKVKTEKTDEQERNVWAEVLSHRNKLLLNSDWTQAIDSGLTDDCVSQWRDWRRQLKYITRSNFSDPEVAGNTIAKLSRRMPFNTYRPADEEPNIAHAVSLDEYRRRVVTYLDKVFHNKMYPSFLDNPYLVDEQFKEALDYLAKGNSLSYPLISVTAELYGMSMAATANEFVARKVESMKLLANLKQKYFYFQTLVNNASTDVELEAVQAEIKEWILTST